MCNVVMAVIAAQVMLDNEEVTPLRQNSRLADSRTWMYLPVSVSGIRSCRYFLGLPKAMFPTWVKIKIHWCDSPWSRKWFPDHWLRLMILTDSRVANPWKDPCNAGQDCPNNAKGEYLGLWVDDGSHLALLLWHPIQDYNSQQEIITSKINVIKYPTKF